MAGNKPTDTSQRDLLLAAMAGLLPGIEPAAEARDRIRARLLAAATTPRMRVLRAEEGEWSPLLPGVRIKTLHRGVDGMETTLWRIEPGACVPPHPHAHEEECLILEGAVLYQGVEYRAGDYLLAEAGLKHEVFQAPAGALLLIRSEPVPREARPPRR